MAQRTEEDSQAILNNGFQRLFNGEESMIATLNRKSAFQEAWNTMNTDITVSIDTLILFALYLYKSNKEHLIRHEPQSGV